MLPCGEDCSGQLIDPVLPRASNPPQLIKIISYPAFMVLFSLLSLSVYSSVVWNAYRHLKIPLGAYLLLWNRIENITLSHFTSTKEDDTFFNEGIFHGWGNMVCPSKTQHEVKNQQTNQKINLLGLLSVHSAVLECWVSFPMWWEAPALAAQSCCGGVYIFLTLGSSNFTVH